MKLSQTLCIAAGLMVSASCGDGVTLDLPQPSTMTVVDGGSQTASAGQTLARLPAVRISDRDGRPVAGVAVKFSGSVGAGQLGGAASVTGSDGVAMLASWTVGTRMGVYTLNATANLAGGPQVASFQVTVLAGPPVAINRPVSAPPTVRAGEPVAPPIVLRVADQYNNPVGGVQFSVSTTASSLGGGSLRTTGSDGTISISDWIGGVAVGAATITITPVNAAPALSPFTLTSTVIGSVPATAVVLSGAAPVVPAGTLAPIDPRVRFLDRFGNPSSGFSVTWTIGRVIASGQVVDQTSGSGVVDANGEVDLGPWMLQRGANVIDLEIVTGLNAPFGFRLTGTGTGPLLITGTEAGWDPVWVSGRNGSSNPAVDTVTVGETVEWDSSDITDAHRVEWTNSEFAPSGVFGYGPPAYRVTFLTPGTYNYFDPYFPHTMAGRIVVR
ncbi:MAG: hypothetical protein ABIR59_10685 [Gemmatimonadales bacterium]